jgi:hypothetical protein
MYGVLWGEAQPLAKGDDSWDSSFSNGHFRQQVACGKFFGVTEVDNALPDAFGSSTG